MENRLNLAIEVAGGEPFDEHFLVEVIGDLAIDEIPEFVGAPKVIDGDDLGHAAVVERADQVGTNKPGSTGDYRIHFRLPSGCDV